ncbi:MFS transporter [Dysgonomonas sp. Marseille-P4361]|uniref:MFS transporter n=1 Tax=Dysgonomonas sp. Marseille-P4361 TaxID=2161820 RepID=UPI000D55AFE5|nr:MFS transporter [Dysgonomonas sp. Marseille-P4361]
MELKQDIHKTYLSKKTLWLMTVGAGLVVANNYYNQPLLGMIARELQVSEEAVSRISMFTQIGYAFGLLLIVPLGDMFKRKKIILGSFGLNILMLLSFGLGNSLSVLLISSLLIGVTSVVPQMFVPIAAQLSAPEDKDRNVATVMSGLLVGILGSRLISGWVGELLGWREMFYIAGGIIFILGVLIFFLLPDIKPTFSGTYKKLMTSILHFARTIPSLQLASVRGGLALASFSAFWTTLTFHLEQPPFNAGSDVAGTLSIFGIAGALSASLVGKLSNKVNKAHMITVAISLMIISWLIFGGAGYTYIGLIAGIILVDMGLQSTHVSNQTIVFSTHPEASNRLNAVYMTSYFIGGSLGTYMGGMAWGRYGWNGVVVVGGMFALLCLIIHLLFCNKKKYQV